MSDRFNNNILLAFVSTFILADLAANTVVLPM